MSDEKKSEGSAGDSPQERSEKSIASEKVIAERTKVRLDREAKALRDNLRKRKGQMRERK